MLQRHVQTVETDNSVHWMYRLDWAIVKNIEFMMRLECAKYKCEFTSWY
jgi:hypothetical protein